ncbi:DUF805 domain-containing protein [Actibacterium sp. 188UL27-1]|uniref:DUF805 domain-containing protein n=1 Tax=Actibacterium sp. 188UL27-1 TaxID=2786961 RepID=UPI00195798D1|nr:DUF805 domain-containing protein [Actibacterium sp. 188UL27-1]MBM7068355.1 DUF805 domain-containing protein [Actibacterium sp. 188UL27-1]
MGPADAIATCLGKYIEVRGRASRPEFWWFVAFLIAGATLAALLDGQLTRWLFPGRGYMTELRRDGLLSLIFCLMTTPPALCAAWRRMHDTGRSGLELFFPCILAAGCLVVALTASILLAQFGIRTLMAVFGQIAMAGCAIAPLVLFWWLLQPGDPNANAYGPRPTGSDR